MFAQYKRWSIIRTKTHVEPEKVQSILESIRALEVYKKATLRQFLTNS
jgi:hypothetical protein